MSPEELRALMPKHERAPFGAIDARDLRNHVMMFGSYAVCHKRGRKWFVEFRGFGPPTAFRTKREAGEYASTWSALVWRQLHEGFYGSIKGVYGE